MLPKNDIWCLTVFALPKEDHAKIHSQMPVNVNRPKVSKGGHKSMDIGHLQAIILSRRTVVELELIGRWVKMVLEVRKNTLMEKLDLLRRSLRVFQDAIDSSTVFLRRGKEEKVSANTVADQTARCNAGLQAASEQLTLQCVRVGPLVHR